MKIKMPTLSICLSCRDGRENFYVTRGGKRFADKLLNKTILQNRVNFRGVNCMSNCDRACTLSLTAEKSFTYIFGDIDPEKSEYAESLIELVSKYILSADGFLRRRNRPPLFQSSILGRLPPIESNSPLVTDLNGGFPNE